MSGKYSELIKKAREPKSQKTSEPDSQINGKPENQKASQPETQISVPEATVEPTPEPEVNLCVKVPKSLRQHWAAEAKRQGITMTAVIVAALTEKFGEPD